MIPGGLVRNNSQELITYPIGPTGLYRESGAAYITYQDVGENAIVLSLVLGRVDGARH